MTRAAKSSVVLPHAHEHIAQLFDHPAAPDVATDAAFHHGAPYSEVARASVHDTDARVGRVLEAVERSGAWDRTAFLLVADHGMESNPEVTGDWGLALDASGVPYRDEAYGFVYLG